MEINAADRAAIRLTLRLATATTLVLLLIGTPLAWWLARSAHWLKSVVWALVAMPLMLPPTALEFYLLVLLGSQGRIGQLTESVGLGILPFTSAALVVGSVLFMLLLVNRCLQRSRE